MEIETKTASLETFAVTIQALHVSGKQMTLAVFRQLPVAYEKDDAQLWGIVRYSIKDEGNMWLVFSLDGKLYRRKMREMLRPNEIDDWVSHVKNSLIEWREKKPDFFMKAERIEEKIKALEKQLKEEIERHELSVRIFEYNQALLLNLPQLFISV